MQAFDSVMPVMGIHAVYGLACGPIILDMNLQVVYRLGGAFLSCFHNDTAYLTYYNLLKYLPKRSGPDYYFMDLHTFLEEKKKDLVRQWFDAVVATYPAETARLLAGQKDPFANPVGRTTLSGLTTVYDAFIKGIDAEVVDAALDPIIRIRSVQDFSPSQAVGFIFALKSLVGNAVGKHARGQKMQPALRAFEADVDRIALLAFDIYMRCREKIYQIKADLGRNSSYRAFKRAGLITETSLDDESAIGEAK